MERLNKYISALFICIITVLGLISFSLCLAAEFKKSKKIDLRLEGKLCYLPGSESYELGIGAAICLSVTQIIGNLFICCSTHNITSCRARIPNLSCLLLLFSWMSFGIALILISAATSMSRRQELGQGWLDGECYIVKDGVYVGSAILVLLTLGSALASATISVRR